MEHLADKLDTWGLVRVLLFEMHDQTEGTILEGSISGTDNDGIPVVVPISRPLSNTLLINRAHHVITLSATGDAETPAGGSVCIRCGRVK